MKGLFDGLKAQKHQQHKADIERALMHYEARVGGKLFGEIPKNHRREFFCLDERTWIWHEEWVDTNNKRQIMTTRYDVRPDVILKSQGGVDKQRIKGDEAKHFRQAVAMYVQRVQVEYGRLLQV